MNPIRIIIVSVMVGLSGPCMMAETVNALDMMLEYREDEVKAADTYNEEDVVVNGVVREKGYSKDGFPFIELDMRPLTHEAFICIFDKDQVEAFEAVKDLNKIKVEGVSMGLTKRDSKMGKLYVLILGDCEFMEVKESRMNRLESILE